MITLQERVHDAPRPATWNVNKLKNVFRVRKGNKNAGMREDNLLSLSYGNVIQKDINSADGLLPESFETYQIVEPGNIVMRLTDLQNDKRSLRQGLVKERGIITSAYDALELTNGQSPRFWAYALLALDLAKYYYSLGGGVRQSIKFSDFPNDWISAPDKESQEEIANFLDRETTQIDHLIDKKRRIIALIRPKWEAMIHAALGEPETKFMRFGMVAEQKLRLILGNNDDESAYTPLGLFNRGRGIFKKAETVAEELGDSTFFWVREGDLILSGQFAWEGAVAYARSEHDKCVVSHRYPVYRARSGIHTAYLFAYLRTEPGQFILSESSRGSAGRNRPLNTRLLEKEKIPIPPLQLQEKITKIVEYEQKLVTLITKSNEQLQEFRSALITAAVTGQIDVSTWGKRGETDRRIERVEEAMEV